MNENPSEWKYGEFSLDQPAFPIKVSSICVRSSTDGICRFVQLGEEKGKSRKTVRSSAVTQQSGLFPQVFIMALNIGFNRYLDKKEIVKLTVWSFITAVSSEKIFICFCVQ